MSDSTCKCIKIVQMNLAAIVATSLGNMITKESYVAIMNTTKKIIDHCMPATDRAAWYAFHTSVGLRSN